MKRKARNDRATKEYDRNLLIRRQSPGALSERELFNSQAERDATAAAVMQAEAVRISGEAELKMLKQQLTKPSLILITPFSTLHFEAKFTDVLGAGRWLRAGRNASRPFGVHGSDQDSRLGLGGNQPTD